MPNRRKQYFGSQFDEQRTKDAHGNTDILIQNVVNLSMEAGSSHFDHLMAFSHSLKSPFIIKYLSYKLKEPRFPRGKSYVGYLDNQIEKILLNHPELRWWMEADGLVVDEVLPELNALSRFDRVAGSLVIEQWKDNELSTPSLVLIAAKLDKEGFALLKNLQPAQRKPISTHNQTNSKRAIKTFSDAVRHPRFAGNVRRRLYVARDRYQRALSRAVNVLL